MFVVFTASNDLLLQTAIIYLCYLCQMELCFAVSLVLEDSSTEMLLLPLHSCSSK